MKPAGGTKSDAFGAPGVDGDAASTRRAATPRAQPRHAFPERQTDSRGRGRHFFAADGSFVDDAPSSQRNTRAVFAS